MAEMLLAHEPVLTHRTQRLHVASAHINESDSTRASKTAEPEQLQPTFRHANPSALLSSQQLYATQHGAEIT
jgi:hypothetical protein